MATPLTHIDGCVLVFSNGARLLTPPAFCLEDSPLHPQRLGRVAWGTGTDQAGYVLRRGQSQSDVRELLYGLARYAVKTLIRRGVIFNAYRLAREIGIPAAEIQRLGGGVRESQMLARASHVE